MCDSMNERPPPSSLLSPRLHTRARRRVRAQYLYFPETRARIHYIRIYLYAYVSHLVHAREAHRGTSPAFVCSWHSSLAPRRLLTERICVCSLFSVHTHRHIFFLYRVFRILTRLQLRRRHCRGRGIYMCVSASLFIPSARAAEE